MLDNRRKFHRFDSDTIVEFRPLKKTNEYSVGMTRDFSSAGFSFESQNYDFEQEEDLEFKLKDPQRDLFVSVNGKAVWKAKSEFACVTGIELKELDKTTRKRMLEIVSDNGNIPDDSFHYGKDKAIESAKKCVYLSFEDGSENTAQEYAERSIKGNHIFPIGWDAVDVSETMYFVAFKFLMEYEGRGKGEAAWYFYVVPKDKIVQRLDQRIRSKGEHSVTSVFWEYLESVKKNQLILKKKLMTIFMSF